MFNTKVRLLLIMIMLFNAILIRPTPVWGCSCVEPSPPQEAFAQAEAVFVGTMTGSGNTLWNPLYARFVQVYHQLVGRLPLMMMEPGINDRAITFEVEDSWRGVNTTQITVRTGQGGGDCGYNFEQEQQYLVYAYEWLDGSLYTGICLRTTALENAGEDLDYLQTVPKLELTDSPLMFNTRMLYLVVALLGPILFAIVIWRRYRMRNEE